MKYIDRLCKKTVTSIDIVVDELNSVRDEPWEFRTIVSDVPFCEKSPQDTWTLKNDVPKCALKRPHIQHRCLLQSLTK